MIRHIVLARLRETTTPDEIAAIFSGLDELRTHLPGILSFNYGANISPENLARGFTHAFTVDFTGPAARDAYLVHPAHKAAGGRLVAACEGGINGILVIDFGVMAQNV